MKLLSETFAIKKIPKVVWSSEDSFDLKPKPLTFVFLVIGLFLFGLGESLLITSGAGVDHIQFLHKEFQILRIGL